MDKLVLSSLGHTWIFDIDGTLVKHNGYKIDGCDTLLHGVKEFFSSNIKDDDVVILLTSRGGRYLETTELFLKEHGIRFNHIISGLPYGERIIVNDKKPSGLETAKAINIDRDNFQIENICFSENL